MRRIQDLWRRHPNVAVWLAMGLIVVTGLGIVNHVRADATARNVAVINQLQTHVADIQNVCVTFTVKHNGLVQSDIDTLQTAITAHTSPESVAIINRRIDAYRLLIVNPRECLPK